jgi:hypothetical protein
MFALTYYNFMWSMASVINMGIYNVPLSGQLNSLIIPKLAPSPN